MVGERKKRKKNPLASIIIVVVRAYKSVARSLTSALPSALAKACPPNPAAVKVVVPIQAKMNALISQPIAKSVAGTRIERMRFFSVRAHLLQMKT